ncbi:HAD-superfamily hydrolase, subfamily IIA OS=Tsukamurella paurometabola (strain ATCC 8368 / DSM/ CCUG 35730 / CIP 100753 / JCM 10117 / KCTC 9821 / NBRC 16120 / NCIMB 702349 / NCTC 13040) OX=521096 GN=Tpau_2385 PE=4 SV=1 [Tsukamurella paurometabola]|uniref:HAD-superfamily hydrolase, subfamily IIA n=1 Tax=Tsukamurella paurometabola (strain ATCC 8368 / DSM 20162 / CCUG 35730 / CIP 100753 / JCM 10117 / KCTC 9821 / NBRC 16120 / NCIMB 702349 / NCTC 13040) TaxID=521096 RepID=D5UR02_TSUPD|nr:HAD hydrolase-like protein [Tsukamurella paurometabola]ADG78991.1 HAD-superfamily hydrolase, subfamily IIA [Tsukamurella paurometabola DSM 20162]SUP33712.1 UMP phosphatase [Tsukamurella paurometabola]
MTTTLVAGYDLLLVDLDGTVYAGPVAIPGAADALTGLPVTYVTNNASRAPSDVAHHLRDLGFAAPDDSVVTSAQAGARLLATLVPPATPTLVVGAPALRTEVIERGLVPVETAEEARAVVQGHNPETGWARLSEAALAIRAGATWVATNTDATLPTERGLMVGNGSMVAAVAHATGAVPRVAGKPGTPILADAVAAAGATSPLVVGDRLDTDIEGGNALGVDTYLVLTGVNDVADVIAAPDAHQPTYIADTLAGLHAPAAQSLPGPRPGWSAAVEGDRLVVTGAADADAADAKYVAVAAARELPAERRASLALVVR